MSNTKTNNKQRITRYMTFSKMPFTQIPSDEEVKKLRDSLFDDLEKAVQKFRDSDKINYRYKVIEVSHNSSRIMFGYEPDATAYVLITPDILMPRNGRDCYSATYEGFNYTMEIPSERSYKMTLEEWEL